MDAPGTENTFYSFKTFPGVFVQMQECHAQDTEPIPGVGQAQWFSWGCAKSWL